MELARALGDPLRWRIVELLASEQLCVAHLAEELQTAQPLVSHHLKVLRAAGLVEGTSLVTLRQPDAAQPVLDAALAAQDPGHLKARSIGELAVATTYVQQREVDQACAIASQALGLPADQRIGPITQRAQDLLRERVVAS